MRMLIAAAVPLLLASAAHAAPTVIDFNSLAVGSSVTNQYAALGVTVAAFENGGPATTVVTDYPAADNAYHSGNFLANDDEPGLSCCNESRADVMRFSFDSGVSALSLGLYTLGGEAVTFNLYDADDLLLETQSVVSASGFGPVSFAATGIRRLDILQPFDNWVYGIDNLSFEATAVPAPAALGLLGLGFASLAAARRRKAA